MLNAYEYASSLSVRKQHSVPYACALYAALFGVPGALPIGTSVSATPGTMSGSAVVMSRPRGSKPNLHARHKHNTAAML